MKKLIIIFASVSVLLAIGSFSAFAADAPEPQKRNVTITVVMPDSLSETAPEETSALEAPAKISSVYPSDIEETREGGTWHIVKTYELGAAENPAEIPRDDFERNGYKFSLSDIIRKETANAETRDHKEVITINTDTKELEKIMPLLSQTMEYKTDDGFVGLLTLDVSSIKVETAGTKTSSYMLSVTREYPRLSTNDSELVPKTVTDNGKTYNLAGVEWKVGNYSTVDYERIPDYYTAVATYTATGSSTKVTGYVTTAEYNGTLAKMAQGKTFYIAYFEGTEIRTPLEVFDLPEPSTEPVLEQPTEVTTIAEQTTEPTIQPTEEPVTVSTSEQSEFGGNNTNLALYVIIALLAMMLGVAFYLLKRKGQNQNEKTNNNAIISDDVNGDDGSGFRG